MNKMSLGRKLAFAACDILGGGAFNIINFLYPVFLALTVGLSAYWISAIMLIARIWDAFFDLLFGQVTDGTKSRFGKRRVYMVAASPFVFVGMVAMFFPYSFDSMTLRGIVVFVSYILFCTIQSVIMVPYFSLASEISSDYHERASANSWRLAFSIASSIVCVSVPGIIVNAFGGSEGYIVMGIIFGAVFSSCVLITGLFAREEIRTPPIKIRFSTEPFLRLLSLRAFRQFMAMLIMLQITMVIMSGLFFFYVNFFYCRDLTASGQANITGLIAAAVMFATQIVALPFYIWWIKKAGKTSAYQLGAILWIVSALVLYLIPSGAPAWQIYLIGFIMGFGISGPGLVPHTMLGDVSDAAQLVFGMRNDGALGGFVHFLNKASQAVGIAFAMAVLGYFGFQEAQPGQTVLQQPESAQMAIRAFMSFTPLVLMGMGIAVSSRYQIDAEKQGQIKKAIETEEKPETLLAELRG